MDETTQPTPVAPQGGEDTAAPQQPPVAVPEQEGTQDEAPAQA